MRADKPAAHCRPVSTVKVISVPVEVGIENVVDEEGNPIPLDKGIIEKGLELIPPTIKEGFDFMTDPLNTTSLPNMPMPRVQTAQANVNPNTNLTRTQEALLSPEEKVIASKRTV